MESKLSTDLPYALPIDNGSSSTGRLGSTGVIHNAHELAAVAISLPGIVDNPLLDFITKKTSPHWLIRNVGNTVHFLPGSLSRYWGKLSVISYHRALDPAYIWATGFTSASVSRVPTLSLTVSGKESRLLMMGAPQCLQKIRFLPGDDS